MIIYKEITPLTQHDVFVIVNSKNVGFDYPIHYHSEFELSLILNSSGNRIVGDSVEKYKLNDLVLIGPEIYHKWDDDDLPPERKNTAHVITIQFSNDILDQPLFLKESFLAIRNLLKDSQRGLKFTKETFKIVSDKMQNLDSFKDFEAVLEFFQILHQLSISKDKSYLSSKVFSSIKNDEKSDRINKMYEYILSHFNDPSLRITELANEFNMSASAFGHFFKKSTNKSFTQFVVDLRLGHSIWLMQNSNKSISEIAFESGFNNIANFNRLFKKNKFVSPKQYKQNFLGSSNFDWEKQLTPNQFIPTTGN